LNKTTTFYKIPFLAIALCLFVAANAKGNFFSKNPGDSNEISSIEKAVAFVDGINNLAPSSYWPNIKPELFLENLKTNIHQPHSPYQGRGTNFCGYGALTYLFIQKDPLGYAQLILKLYQQGEATYGNTHFKASDPIKIAAGKLRFKGILDIRPAEQMWYLCLADHYKGYLNIFNRRYDPGDEDKVWASVNYAKFNRMVKKLLNYKVKAKGADLFHPHVGDLYLYISEHLKTGSVVLYINNRLVHKKNNVRLKPGFPTHYIVLKEIIEAENKITLVYWDYGGKTLIELTPALMKKITFGIVHCTKK
jgi:hypothetical protein